MFWNKPLTPRHVPRIFGQGGLAPKWQSEPECSVPWSTCAVNRNSGETISERPLEGLPHAVGPAAHEVRGAIVQLLSNESRDVRQWKAICNHLKNSKRSWGGVPENFGKEGSLERRRRYLRGFPTTNCNGVRTKKAKIAPFVKPIGPEAYRRLTVIILRQKKLLIFGPIWRQWK